MISTQRIRKRLMALFRQPVFWFITIWGHACIAGGSLAFYFFEHDTNPKVRTAIDTVYWAIATVTTVGYGDVAPVTTGGKIVGIGMMILGFLFIWSYTTLFVSAIVSPELREVEDEVANLEKGLKAVKREIHLDEKSLHLLRETLEALTTEIRKGRAK